jgi:sugar/nucleoside kinase (ribokinase family)
MTRAGRVAVGGRFDYVTVGHVTIDVLADGSRRPGGSAFYSALQAARLGARALVLTRGVREEIEGALAPFASELELHVEPAAHTTTFATSGAGSTRAQRLLSWAEPIPARALHAEILHLAPVARELHGDWAQTRAPFVGLTPQGLVREWRREDRLVELGTPAAGARELAARCDALVLSEHELASCAALLDAARLAGASVAVTAGASPTRLLAAGEELVLGVLDVESPRDDLGAGDVFAAAFFVALAEGLAPADAAAFAHAAAAVRLEGRGPRAVAARASIERRLRAHPVGRD